jgi:type IV secretory pathway TrbF-like protein
MSNTVADLPVKTLNGAESRYVETYGSTLVQNTYLKGALGLALLALCGGIGLLYHVQTQAAQIKPIIVRIDELGRHDVVPYDVATNAAPRANELRHDLRTFIRQHYSRRHGAVGQDFAESLFFLEPTLSESADREHKPDIDKFLSTPSAEEVEIEIKQIKLVELTTPPFKAQVDFEKHFYQPASRAQQKKPELFTAQIEYRLRDSVPNDYVLVNPLGIQITYVHLDEAF